MDEEQDEITEVFKDLTFLDNEDSEEIIVQNEITMAEISSEDEPVVDPNAET